MTKGLLGIFFLTLLPPIKKSNFTGIDIQSNEIQSGIRITDVHVVGYAKERTIHFGPGSIDSANTILILQTAGEYMKKIVYWNQALL